VDINGFLKKKKSVSVLSANLPGGIRRKNDKKMLIFLGKGHTKQIKELLE